MFCDVIENFNNIPELLKCLHKQESETIVKILPVLITIEDPRIFEFIIDASRHNAHIKQRMNYYLCSGVGIFRKAVHVQELDFFSEICKRICCKSVGKTYTINCKEIERINGFDFTNYSHAIHPITGEKIDEITVEKSYVTLNRPILIHPKPSQQKIIIKRGTDIMNGHIAETVFELINDLMKKYLIYNNNIPFIKTYSIIHAECDWGYIGFVEDTIDFLELESTNYEHVTDIHTFVRTLSGCIIGCYLLGIADRHYENFLFEVPTNQVIPIDFDFMLGIKSPGVDTYEIPINLSLYKFLFKKKVWNQFINLTIRGLMIIRENYNQISQILFSLTRELRNEKFVRKFFKNKLLIGKSNKTARKLFLKKLRHAPVCSNNKFKHKLYPKFKKIVEKHPNYLQKVVAKKVLSKPKVKPGRNWGHVSVVKIEK